jgi:hypothetical protein
MAEERPSTPPFTLPSTLSPPVLMRRRGQVQKVSDKERLKIDIFDFHRAISSSITDKITLETILNFMNNNKEGSVDYLTKKIKYIEYIYENKKIFEDDFDEYDIYNKIIELYESLINIKTAIRLFRSGISGVVRTGLDKKYSDKYYNKYLKYKKKYLELKKQIGGGEELNKFDKNEKIKIILENTNRMLTNATSSVISSFLFNISKLINDELLLKELSDIKHLEIEYVGNIFKFKEILQSMNSRKLEYFIEKSAEKKDQNPGFFKLVELLSSDFVTKSCTVEEFMTLDDVTVCNNPSLVRGSCGEPSFFDELNKINSDNENILQLLEFIDTKIEKGKSIYIVVGALLVFEQTGDYNFFITPSIKFKDFNEVLKEIGSDGFKNDKSPYIIKGSFPLNIKDSNKTVLDKIIKMSEEYKITFVNKICGSCFRSMYYLVKYANSENFSYVVKPEQGLGRQDTESIQKCFKNI